jgi:hypothetical protein
MKQHSKSEKRAREESDTRAHTSMNDSFLALGITGEVLTFTLGVSDVFSVLEIDLQSPRAGELPDPRARGSATADTH